MKVPVLEPIKATELIVWLSRRLRIPGWRVVVSAFLLLLSIPSTPARGSSLSEEDFALGFRITVTTQGPVQTVLIPPEVYRGVVRPDLGDLRIFNGQGEEVPHSVRTLVTRAQPESTRENLPLFPLRGDRPRGVESLGLTVDRSTDGTVISIRDSPSPRPDSEVLAYVLDAGSSGAPIRRLTISWEPPEEGFVLSLRVDACDDLLSWHTVADRVPIVQLVFGRQRLERNTIELPMVGSRFLRLSWPDGVLPMPFQSVQAERVGTAPEPPRVTVELEAEPEATNETWFRVDTGGPMPVDQLQVLLPHPNTVVEAELLSSQSPEEGWLSRYHGLLYRIIADGEEITNTPIEIGAAGQRYWQVRIDSRGGGLGGGRPTLQLGWRPQQLLFVARGTPPYLMAYGSYKAKPSAFDLERLFGVVPGLALERLPVESATLEAPRVLAGESARAAPPPPFPWKEWLLWATLLAGVALLGWMTWRLARQLGASPPEG